MDFSKAVEWWEEWQLRVLVLASLFIQYFLFIAAPLRKRNIPSWFRFLTWLAYLGGDAIAIYGLATLFNRRLKQEWVSMHHSSVSLQALWAPIFLLHLGGQDGITAYNIEDNELWRRHVLTALSQISVAVYVFRKSWPGGNKRLLQAAILVFVPGIVKCLEKPWALKNASISSVAASSSGGSRSKNGGGDDVSSLDQYVRDASTYVRRYVRDASPHTANDFLRPFDDCEGDASTFVQAVRDGVAATTDGASDDRVEVAVAQDKPYNLFVDLAFSYSDRLENLKYMVENRGKVIARLRSGLSKAFDRLYTKDQVHKGPRFGALTWKRYLGDQLRLLVVYLLFAAIALYHKSRKDAYDDVDVKITYAVLCCTTALEYLNNHVKSMFDWCMQLTGLPWPDQVSQYNLIGYLSRNKSSRHRRLRRLLRLLCRSYIDQHWTMEPRGGQSCREIIGLVYDHVVKGGWKGFITGAATYRSFIDSRGQHTLHLHREADCGTAMYWSLRRPFDESVLLWHLATDFFFHQAAQDYAGSRRSREISNYMAYLLFANPEMLMAGARSTLFRDAYKELNSMLGQGDGGAVVSERELTQRIIDKLERGSAPDSSIILVRDAWELAKELKRVGGGGDDDKMWDVIQGVWVEMLCFSAGTCRGYLHAKSLGKGGEHLSYIWLLLLYLGMETLAEKLQRTELNPEGEVGPTSASATTTATGGGMRMRSAEA